MIKQEFVIKRWRLYDEDEDLPARRGVTIIPIIGGFENFKNSIIKEEADSLEKVYFDTLEFYEKENSMYEERWQCQGSSFFQEWYELYEGEGEPAVTTDFKFPNVDDWKPLSFHCVCELPTVGNYSTNCVIEHQRRKIDKDGEKIFDGVADYRDFTFDSDMDKQKAWKMLQRIYPNANYKVHRFLASAYEESGEHNMTFITMSTGYKEAMDNEGFYDKWCMLLSENEKIEDWLIGRYPIERGPEDELPF